MSSLSLFMFAFVYPNKCPSLCECILASVSVSLFFQLLCAYVQFVLVYVCFCLPEQMSVSPRACIGIRLCFLICQQLCSYIQFVLVYVCICLPEKLSVSPRVYISIRLCFLICQQVCSYGQFATMSSLSLFMCVFVYLSKCPSSVSVLYIGIRLCFLIFSIALLLCPVCPCLCLHLST